MKKKKLNIKTVIRQIVREEVAMAIKEVITELKQPIESQPQPKKIVEKKSYTNNSVLNDVLNETAASDEWKTMGDGQYTSDRMNEVIGKNYGDIMNTNTPIVNSNDPMSQFLNKDYSQVLEKSIEKSKNKLGR
jgi:hypothetical protein